MQNTLVKLKYPPNLVLTAVLSGGLTISISLIYILLGLALIILRFNCDAGVATTGAGYFWTSILRTYILNSECDNKLQINAITSDFTVFILVAVTMVVSILNLVTAIYLITTIQNEEKSQYASIAVYCYVSSFGVSLVVDLTTASVFGKDLAYLTRVLGLLTTGSPSNYLTEVIRQGAFWLMTIALKGYVAYIVNGIFIILLLVYIVNYKKTQKLDEHSIHKLGALNAFDQQSKPGETWSQPELYLNSQLPRGPQINSVFVEDSTPSRSPRLADPSRAEFFSKSHINNAYVDDRTPPRSPSRRLDSQQPDYFSSNDSFDRSDSWQHSHTNIPAQNPRPFSYLEEIKRQVPVKPPPSPAADTPWNRDPWQGQMPPVPAPDYSPQPRRLKSALKPSYM